MSAEPNFQVNTGTILRVFYPYRINFTEVYGSWKENLYNYDFGTNVTSNSKIH